MRLADFFLGGKSISGGVKTHQNTVPSGTVRNDGIKNEGINRQLQSLTPGQTIQGEIVSKNGGEVQIRLADDTMLQAKVDRNMNLEVGKMVTFEVKSNGQTLTLGPLFTNTAMEANVLKALEMASLPVNQTSLSMTKQLMEAGMSIDRNTLQQFYREANLFPKAQIADIINLHKLAMPVNENNVAQMASYRNLTHQLVKGLNNVLEALPDVISHLIETKDTEGAAKLYGQLLTMTQEGVNVGENAEAGGNTVQNANQDVAQNLAPNEGTISTQNGALTETDKALIQNIIRESISIMDNMQSGENGNGMQAGDILHPGETVQPGEALQTNPAGKSVTPEMTEVFLQGESVVIQDALPGATNLADATMQNHAANFGALNHSADTQALETLIKSLFGRFPDSAEEQKAVLKPLLDFLQRQWTITPEEVADKEQVENLYHRLDKQLKGLTNVLENIGQTENAAYKAVTNLSQNVEFLQQVNQAYTYVQLPLRLQQGEAHGELYVYTNKKHLAREDGQISALLHLDMEHLGPVDVYVAMMGENVNTKFYVCDDEMLDFLMGHMDILTKRLEKRGYQCSFDMQVRKQGEHEESGISSLLQQESTVPLAEYSFDVRT